MFAVTAAFWTFGPQAGLECRQSFAVPYVMTNAVGQEFFPVVMPNLFQHPFFS
jgi:hypothetical protein